jgi:hypothetical protein
MTVFPPGATEMGLPAAPLPGAPRNPTMGGVGSSVRPGGPPSVTPASLFGDADDLALGAAGSGPGSLYGGGAGLGNLPAPKRASPLAGVEALARPLPKSGLAAAGDLADIVDLPMPKASAQEIVDLLTPVGPFPTAQGLAPAGPPPGPPGLDDLLAPVGPSGDDGIDLPAPKGFFDDVPAPKNLRADPFAPLAA